MRLVCLSCCLLFTAAELHADNGPVRIPEYLLKRVPLTTSTVIGSPDPLPPYRVKQVFANLDMRFPIAVAHQPGSDRLLYITQQSSYGDTTIRRVKDDPTTNESEILLEMKGSAYSIAFHPKFADNGYLYIGWNGPAEKGGKHTRVTRYTMSPKAPYTFDPTSAKLIIEWPSDGHNGGAVCFGTDGYLYITSGDGTSDSDTNVMGQRLDNLLSKVLRIDVDHPSDGKAYSVPKDNPFVGQKGIAPETWAYGLRNPWRIAADAKTGHIWVGNNGQDLWEQVYFVRKGDNYGWSVYEGSHPFYLNRQLGPHPHVKPTFEHHHSAARSLTGGIVYYGKKFPDLVGAYIYGDYSTGRIWAGKHDGSKVLWHKEIAQTRLQITGFATDSAGEILICDHVAKGAFYTLEPTPKDLPPTKFPRKLSESGLFASVKGHVMQPGVLPYSINAPFWSDGAHKERFIAVPGADTQIEYRRTRGWNFPDQTVIVKSFALEMEEGNPASRRWIETRFLTKQGKEWFGYSYLWNDEQTDGTLVESAGMDRTYTIKTGKGGVRLQKWHYPSRAECMVCHSRAANWVLGLSEVQMNKEHDYGGGCQENQLRVLEHLGILKFGNTLKEVKKAIRDEMEKNKSTKEQIEEALQKPAVEREPWKAPNVSAILGYGNKGFRKLVDPFDKTADLTLRVKSFLHSNCSSCHVEAGGGNAQMDLEFTTPLEKMRIVDAKPVHNPFGIMDARLIAPGHPERSVLLYRISHRKEGHMPPLSTYVHDPQAVALLEEWIRKMKK